MLFVYQTVPESQVLSYLPHSQTNHHNEKSASSLSSSSLSYSSSSRSTSSVNSNHPHQYTESEIERMKHCGSLFERRSVVNRLLTNEFFRREPCLYNQLTYKNSARIFNCLKADLNENPILKSLKQQRAKEAGESFIESHQVTEVPKITYDNNQEKRNTLQLAFSTLKFQKVLEDLIEEVQFYGNHPEFKDDQSLVCTILFDYMTRKFQLRDRLCDEPYDNEDQLVTQIETSIYKNKTDLAAELAKNRIKADALTLDDLLPSEVKEVEHHKAELPLYCWVNPLKINLHDLIHYLIEVEGLKQADSKKSLEKKCFMIDPHCNSLLMFHYALRSRILNSDLVKQFKLIVQDKSSCLAPHTVLKLLSKKDDVIVTNVTGGLLTAFLGCMMEEYEGKVYAYGATNEDKYNEITNKLQAIGCLKYVRVMREDFMSTKYDESKLENVKVILVNAPCSKSALMNPMEFLFEEGEDVKYLRDYTLDANKPSKIRKCIQDEYSLMKHALRFPKVKAIVYQTYSKNSQENEQIVHRAIDEFNELRKFPIFPYKITPPVIPLTAEDIQNDEVVKDFKFLQFKPSTKMNGCFIALLSRDRDAKLDFIARKQEHHEKKIKQSAPEPATFQEKNFLPASDEPKKVKKSAPELAASLTGSRSKSPKKNSLRKNKLTKQSSQVFNNIEEEIKRLQMQDDQNHQQQQQISIFNLERQDSNIKNKIILTKTASDTNQIQSSSSLFDLDRRSSLDKLTQIGKLDPYRHLIDGFVAPKRSSTPTETKQDVEKSIHLKTYHFKASNVNLTTIDASLPVSPKTENTTITTTETITTPPPPPPPPPAINSTNSLLFERNTLNKVKSDLDTNLELESVLSSARKMNEMTDRKIYLENAILSEELTETKSKQLLNESDIIDEKDIYESNSSHNIVVTDKSKRTLKKPALKHLSDNYIANNLNDSLQQQHQSVTLKRVQFASDSLPSLNTFKSKKGFKKQILSSSNGERILNDVFVPKRQSLDYTNYNPLLTMKMNRQNGLINRNEASQMSSGGKRTSPPPPLSSTNYTFKEFKLQVLKKKSINNKQPHLFGQASLTNIQKRYFSNTNKSNHNHASAGNLILSPFENLSFSTQSLSLKDASHFTNTTSSNPVTMLSTTNLHNSRRIKLNSVSDTNLNKSYSTKQNTL